MSKTYNTIDYLTKTLNTFISRDIYERWEYFTEQDIIHYIKKIYDCIDIMKYKNKTFSWSFKKYNMIYDCKIEL